MAATTPYFFKISEVAAYDPNKLHAYLQGLSLGHLCGIGTNVADNLFAVYYGTALSKSDEGKLRTHVKAWKPAMPVPKGPLPVAAPVKSR